MMRFWRRAGSGGDDDEGGECDWIELCSACIVVGGAKVVVCRKRDGPFTCARCQTLVDERWMDGDGRSALQSPVAALKKTAIKGKL